MTRARYSAPGRAGTSHSGTGSSQRHPMSWGPGSGDEGRGRAGRDATVGHRHIPPRLSPLSFSVRMLYATGLHKVLGACPYSTGRVALVACRTTKSLQGRPVFSSRVHAGPDRGRERGWSAGGRRRPAAAGMRVRGARRGIEAGLTVQLAQRSPKPSEGIWQRIAGRPAAERPADAANLRRPRKRPAHTDGPSRTHRCSDGRGRGTLRRGLRHRRRQAARA